METLDKTAQAIAHKKTVVDYLTKTSNHLFVTESNKFFKVILVEAKDSIHAFQMTFGNGNCTIREINIVNYVSWYGASAKSVISDSLFPNYNKRTSIKHFRKMNALLDAITILTKETDFIEKAELVLSDPELNVKIK